MTASPANVCRFCLTVNRTQDFFDLVSDQACANIESQLLCDADHLLLILQVRLQLFTRRKLFLFLLVLPSN